MEDQQKITLLYQKASYAWIRIKKEFLLMQLDQKKLKYSSTIG